MDEYSAQDDVNVSLAEQDPKLVEKPVMRASDAGNIPGSSDDTLHEETNEDVADTKNEIVITAKSLENEEIVELSNVENEAVLSNTIREEATSSGKSSQASLTERQSAAIKVIEMSKETRRIVAKGRSIIGIISSTAQIFQLHVGAFEKKARKIPKYKTYRNILADFYRTVISNYQAAIVDLDNRSRYVDEALNRVENSTRECLQHATLIEQIMDETLDESRRLIHATERYIDEGKNAIIFALKEERSALSKARELWLGVTRDILHEKRARLGLPWNSDDEPPPRPQSDGRNVIVIILHILFLIIGFALIYVASLFRTGSESFISILFLAFVFLVWCGSFLLYRLHKFINSRNYTMIQEETAAETLEKRALFLEKCDDNLHDLERDLVNYGESLHTETNSSLYTETHAGSSETVGL